MRVFVGLNIDSHIRTRLQSFIESTSRLVPEARWVSPNSFHVTLKFIGNQSDDHIQQIKAALSPIRSSPLQLTLDGLRFFPESKSPRIFAIGFKANVELVSLAATVDKTMASLGIPEEIRPYSPHITLARAKSGAQHNRNQDRLNHFQTLQENLAASVIPEFGTIAAREFFLYESRSSAQGSRYIKIARFDLR